MALYLFHGSYTPEGTKGLLKDGGSKRRDVVKKMIEKVGGKLHSVYYALGEDDVYLIAEIADPVDVLAISLTVNSSGSVHLKTTALMTVDEVDAATKKSIAYKAPGA